MATTEYLTNENIKAPTVLLIDSEGNQVGAMPLNAALNRAKTVNLDLICVAPNAQPPVCKILDFGKFKFDQQKRQKELKKKQKECETSEIQFTLVTQEHDIETKINTTKRLIEKGNYVRVVLRLRGREVTMAKAGIEKLKEYTILCKDFAKVRKPIFQEGRDLKLILEAL